MSDVSLNRLGPGEGSLAARLNALPQKVALPLRELLAVGQLSDDALGTVLDATELARSPAKALGFAVGYLHLQSQGVPVKDVIRMARSQKRRIRLNWSVRRWREEHDRLSRAETLMRLGEVNVRYDLRDVAAWLPRRFRGYLIRSSRRLGMEGLRQRHCVAAYHAQIQAGYCAIVAVFVDRKRWTVQLACTGDEEVPLRIVQIRSRFNTMPTRDIRETIHGELGIVPAPAYMTVDEERLPRTYIQNLRRILPVLRAQQVKQVRVSFDGSGDEGSIDDVSYEGAEIDDKTLMVEIEIANRVLNGGKWSTTRELERKNLGEAIEHVTDDYLAEAGVDWYNGDGGFGELIIDVVEGRVSLEVQVRVLESSMEFSATRDIATGEEVEE
jgi:hypothetical protein